MLDCDLGQVLHPRSLIWQMDRGVGVGSFLSMTSFLILKVMCGEVKRSRAESGAAHLDAMWLPLAFLSLGIQPVCVVGILWCSFVGAWFRSYTKGWGCSVKGIQISDAAT